jgi:hypothetical protein
MGSELNCNWPLFRQALEPSAGTAPRPPAVLNQALELLDPLIASQLREFATNRAAQAGDLNVAVITRRFASDEEFRDCRAESDDYGGIFLDNALARSIRAVPAVKRARVGGLTADSAARWVRVAQSIVTPDQRSCVASYVYECRQWEQRLEIIISSMAADPDWDMGSAVGVRPSAPEARLPKSFEQGGIPLQPQVGVSRVGGRRHGGWFQAFWLDWAYRDVPFLLRLDIELDGASHRTPEGEKRNRVRNILLQSRGWYVLRFDSRTLDLEQHKRAVNAVVKLVQRHRRAILLARTDFQGVQW